MNLVLDTHAYLWFLDGNDRLSDEARLAIENTDNRKFISSASLWEITVKYSLGKLSLAAGIQPVLTDLVERNGFHILPIEPRHLLQLSELSMHHSDPFDRLIIAQSIAEGFSLCSVDSKFQLYGVNLVW